MRFFENGIAGDHHAEVFDFVVVAGEHDPNDVFTDVVDVAFDGGDQEFTCGRAFGGFALFGLHEWQQVRDGALHDAGAFDHLWEEHIAIAEELTDDLHSVHQRAFDHVEWSRVFEASLFGIGVDVRDDAFDECMGQAFFNGAVAPVVL